MLPTPENWGAFYSSLRAAGLGAVTSLSVMSASLSTASGAAPGHRPGAAPCAGSAARCAMTSPFYLLSSLQT